MQVIVVVPNMIQVHMAGVTHAVQEADGSVTLHYVDSTTESARLKRQITPDENFFGIVSEVQEKSRRPVAEKGEK